MNRLLVLVLLTTASSAGLRAADPPALKDGPYVGTIELTETLIAPLETERIVERPVKEGSLVKAGEILARLDTSLLEADAARLEAEVGSRAARLRELDAGFRVEEIRQARATKLSAESRRDLARIERARAEKLLASGAGSQAAVDRTRSEEEAATRDAESSAARLSLLEAGQRSEERDRARSDLDAAKRSLDLLRQRIDRMILKAPADAVVLDTYYEPGEVVPAGRPVVKLGDVRAPYVDIYVAPEDLSALRIGSELPVTVDGLAGRTFRGKVTELGAEAEFTPRAILTPRERARLVYRVRVGVEGGDADLRPGVPAEVAGP